MSLPSRVPSSGQSPGLVRFKISYKSPEALLGQFTRSVGKGMVVLESQQRAPVGTRFVFELRASGVSEPLEVLGEVLEVKPTDEGKFLLAIRYDPKGGRAGVDAVLQSIVNAHQYEKIRRHPRIPLQLVATAGAPGSPSYLVRDISRGGMGVEFEGPRLPEELQVGTPVLLELSLSLGTLALRGETAWVFVPPTDGTAWANPAFGVVFGKLPPDTVERLEKILTLRGLPPPPWRARIGFGEAVPGPS